MSVSLDTRIEDAYAAGFRGSALVGIVCISLCECGIGSASGCETGCNPDAGAESCGVLQIYQPAHPGTAACASDPACCFTLGWQISNHGTDFHPWTTFQNGCWATHIATVTAAINALPPPIGPGSGDPCLGVVCDRCSNCAAGVCVSRCLAGDTCVGGVCTPPSPPPGSPAGALATVVLVGSLIGVGIWAARRQPGSGTSVGARVRALDGGASAFGSGRAQASAPVRHATRQKTRAVVNTRQASGLGSA